MADLFAYVWVHSEGCLTKEQIDFLFEDCARRGIDRSMIISPAEQSEFASLPDPITIFRGCQESTRAERSWSLSQDKARPFARRAADENMETHTGLIIKSTCPKTAVLAYLNRHLAEQKIIVNPEQMVILPEPVETVTNDE